MSARKLGHLAGLVFVLAAIFGGIGTATAGHGAEGSTAVTIAFQAETSWG